MTFVIDASIAACWVFRDEEHHLADLALRRLAEEDAIAPSLWWFELRNVLIANERRKRITQSDSAAFLNSLARLEIGLDRTPKESEVLRLARTHRLSVYDAAYLELALRLTIPLATLDGDLIRAAKAEGVVMLG
jgi:predicted nucleic acid-binding protein